MHLACATTPSPRAYDAMTSPTSPQMRRVSGISAALVPRSEPHRGDIVAELAGERLRILPKLLGDVIPPLPTRRGRMRESLELPVGQPVGVIERKVDEVGQARHALRDPVGLGWIKFERGHQAKATTAFSSSLPGVSE